MPPIDASSSSSTTTTASGKSSKQPAASPKGAAESKGLWAKWRGVLTSLDFWLVNLSNLLVYFVPPPSHNDDRDQNNSGLSEIYLRFAMPILVLILMRRSRSCKDS